MSEDRLLIALAAFALVIIGIWLFLAGKVPI